jgi:hypothetical protein
MKSRLAAAVVLAATGVVAAVSVASSAQASASGYVKYASYGWNEQCLNIGYTGQLNHAWSSYYCQTISPSGATGPGLYNLYVLY